MKISHFYLFIFWTFGTFTRPAR